jgi:hypothetical protein
VATSIGVWGPCKHNGSLILFIKHWHFGEGGKGYWQITIVKHNSSRALLQGVWFLPFYKLSSWFLLSFQYFLTFQRIFNHLTISLSDLVRGLLAPLQVVQFEQARSNFSAGCCTWSEFLIFLAPSSLVDISICNRSTGCCTWLEFLIFFAP